MKKTIYAPAKINIVLKVKGLMPNGYHDLFMLNEKLDVADEISLEVLSSKPALSEVPSLSRDEVEGFEACPERSPELVEGRSRRVRSEIPEVRITCDDPNVPCDETNLCHKAAMLFTNEISKDLRTYALTHSRTAVNIHIKKKIPVAAGLGGGSSDAAAVLKGLNELYDFGWSNEKLASLGVKLGADVPFFLYDGPAICEGIGDEVKPLNRLPNMWILLINPGFAVSTRYVYETFDKMHGLQLTDKNSHASLPCFFKELRDIVKVVHNDLELVTAEEYPEIKQIKKLLTDNGAVISWMSGSGPTVVGLFAEEKVSKVAAQEMKSQNEKWRVIETSNIA